MNALISIIIPCYNAAPWLAQAIQSCLDQSYRPIEIIIVDDGSTDGSLDIIKHFASLYPDLIRLETQANRGAPAARNRGFELSRGEYIQWLDADDLLAPGKLIYQARILQSGQADVVTGWWKHLTEETPGEFVEGPLYKPVLTDDPVASLIGDPGWAPPSTYLMKRAVVEAVGGWDERLTCMQDVDFILRVAMQGSRFSLVPHLCAYYRRPLRDTVSTRDRSAFTRNCFNIYNQVYCFFERTGWNGVRRRVLVECYGSLARYYFEHDRMMFERCLAKIHALSPDYTPAGPPPLRVLTRLFGYRNAERIALTYRRSKRVLVRAAR